jgi:hypothetical protein
MNRISVAHPNNEQGRSRRNQHCHDHTNESCLQPPSDHVAKHAQRREMTSPQYNFPALSAIGRPHVVPGTAWCCNYLRFRHSDANNAVFTAVSYNSRRLIHWRALFPLRFPRRVIDQRSQKTGLCTDADPPGGCLKTINADIFSQASATTLVPSKTALSIN